MRPTFREYECGRPEKPYTRILLHILNVQEKPNAGQTPVYSGEVRHFREKRVCHLVNTATDLCGYSSPAAENRTVERPRLQIAIQTGPHRRHFYTPPL
jgi:hypothetical protein